MSHEHGVPAPAQDRHRRFRGVHRRVRHLDFQGVRWHKCVGHYGWHPHGCYVSRDQPHPVVLLARVVRTYPHDGDKKIRQGFAFALQLRGAVHDRVLFHVRAPPDPRELDGCPRVRGPVLDVLRLDRCFHLPRVRRAGILREMAEKAIWRICLIFVPLFLTFRLRDRSCFLPAQMNEPHTRTTPMKRRAVCARNRDAFSILCLDIGWDRVYGRFALEKGQQARE